MNPFEEAHDKFINREGKKFYYIKHVRDDLLHVWEVQKFGDACNSGICRGMRLRKEPVDKEILEEAGIWKDLPADLQDEISGEAAEVQEAVKEKMAGMRAKRKKKFTDLPEFLNCACGRETKANYSYLQKKADKMMVPLDDLIKNYKCQTCNPTKGKRK
jgi:hypothetical protein